MGMNSALSIAVSGLTSFSSALSVVADNVANANTTAYKTNTMRFADMVAGYEASLSQETNRQGAGSTVMSIDTNLSQGPMITTGNWSDVSVNGSGYFSVQDTSTTQLYYTRDGAFHIDSSGYLVNAEGYQVLSTAGAAIQVEANPAVPTHSNYSISSSGQITGTNNTTGALENIGSPIRLSTFANPGGLVRTGGNRFIPGPESGTAVNGAPGTAPCGSLIAASLEGSNVDLATEMVNMVIYQADFTANSKSIQTANYMLDTVVNLVR